MRKPTYAALVGLLATALVAVALAPLASASTATTASAGGPLTAGTKAHPQGLKVQMDFQWHGLSEALQPILTNMNIWFPQGSVYNGGRYPRCTVRALDAFGPAKCPKASIMGHGAGIAYADTAISRPEITVVNGGPSTIYFYTVLNNPARVQEPIVGHLTRTHGDYDYHLSVTIPQNIRVVAGVPIELTDLNVSVGRGTWLATTGSPAGIKVMTTFSTGEVDTYTVWAQDS